MSRERRRLFHEEESPVEPGRYGCPMLIRAHRTHPLQANHAMMRCSLGWALHGEVEVERCLATEAVIDCWKEHPERMSMVVILPTRGPDSGKDERKVSAD